MKLNKVYLVLLILLSSSITLFTLENKPSSNRIAVVVNQFLKAEIETNLDIYLQDLRNEGYDPILIPWSLEKNPTPKALKDTLIKLYEEEKSLQGAVMIGDLPIPMQKIADTKSHREWASPSMTFASEIYYMNLIGSNWKDTLENEQFEKSLELLSASPKFSSFLEEKASDSNNALVIDYIKESLGRNYLRAQIWVSHIIASTVTNVLYRTEPELINAYLEKNHAYRTGQIIFPKNAIVLPITEVDEAFKLDEYYHIIKMLKSKYNVEEIIAKTRSTFLEPFYTYSPEIALWGRHGFSDGLVIAEGVYLTSNDLALSNSLGSSAFLFPDSCDIGQYTADGYFAGVFLFKSQFFTLGIPTSTITSFGYPLFPMIEFFLKNNNIGNSFLEYINKFDSEYSFVQESEENYVRNSKYILGDGTLKLQSHQTAISSGISPNDYLSEIQVFNNRSELLEDRMKTAMRFKYDQLIKHSIEEGANINVTYDGDTPLIYSIENDKPELTKYLLDHGADIEKTNNEGESPLFVAFIKRNLIIAQMLIENGAKLDVNAKNSKGQTALFFSVENNYTEVTKFLLDHGANFRKLDESEKPSLFHAIDSNNKDFAQFLISKGVNVNIKYKRETPLIYSIIKNKPEMAKFLIDHGADLEAKKDRDRRSETALFFSVKNNDIEITKYLLDRGANLEGINRRGETALFEAIKVNNSIIVQLLIDHGVNLEAKNIYDETPLDVARQRGHSHIETMIMDALAKKSRKNEL